MFKTNNNFASKRVSRIMGLLDKVRPTGQNTEIWCVLVL